MISNDKLEWCKCQSWYIGCRLSDDKKTCYAVVSGGLTYQVGIQVGLFSHEQIDKFNDMWRVLNRQAAY